MSANKLSLKDAAEMFCVKYDFKIFPLVYKDPAVKSMNKIYSEVVTLENVRNMMNRQNVTGMGVVLGHRYLRGIDIDGVSDVTVVLTMLQKLGLSQDYQWVVKSGSGKGYHLYFYCDDDVDGFFTPNRAYYKFYFREYGSGKQIELRWNRCYMAAPFSLHPSGINYEFINELPNSEPAKVNIENVANAIKCYCELLERGYKKSKQVLTKADTRNLDGAIEFLRTHKLSYEEWINCGFALASLGLSGKKKFVRLGTNEFYDDSEEILEYKFDYLLSRYDPTKITVRTLFGIATDKGYTQPKYQTSLNGRFLEFELCALRFPEKDINKIKKIRNYAFMRALMDDEKVEKITDDVILEELAKSNFEEDIQVLRSDYGEMLEYVLDIVEKEKEQPFCRVGEDFVKDVLEKRFDYLSFCLLSAVTAIQGKGAKYKNITKDRLSFAILGYKSDKCVNDFESLNTIMPSDHKIRVRVRKLVEKSIMSAITIYRITTYSTFLSLNELAKVCEKRYMKGLHKKNEHQLTQRKIMKRIKEAKEKMINDANSMYTRKRQRIDKTTQIT